MLTYVHIMTKYEPNKSLAHFFFLLTNHRTRKCAKVFLHLVMRIPRFFFLHLVKPWDKNFWKESIHLWISTEYFVEESSCLHKEVIILWNSIGTLIPFKQTNPYCLHCNHSFWLEVLLRRERKKKNDSICFCADWPTRCPANASSSTEFLQLL